MQDDHDDIVEEFALEGVMGAAPAALCLGALAILTASFTDIKKGVTTATPRFS